MEKAEKKYRRSPISIACYVLAAAMLVYVCYLIGSTIQTINTYYAQYGMSAQPMEYITYTLQAALQPIVYTVVFFMLGCILDAVRMNNENNYKTDEELAQAAAAKKQAREAKKIAKGEAAAIKAGNVTTDEISVEADFARSLDEELKADEKKAENKTGNGSGGGNRKPRNNNYNRSDSNRNNSNRSGNSGRKRPEGGKNEGGKKEEGKKEGGKKEGGSGKSGGNGGQRRSSNRKPADRPKLEDATKAKADDGFEVVIAEPESKE